jgi:hypothetical protein
MHVPFPVSKYYVEVQGQWKTGLVQLPHSALETQDSNWKRFRVEYICITESGNTTGLSEQAHKAHPIPKSSVYQVPTPRHIYLPTPACNPQKYPRNSMHEEMRRPVYRPAIMLSKAGIKVCASQKENVSLGPVIRSYTSRVSHPCAHGSGSMSMQHTLGTSPLKKAEKPSFRAILVRIRIPLSGLSKFLF